MWNWVRQSLKDRLIILNIESPRVYTLKENVPSGSASIFKLDALFYVGWNNDFFSCDVFVFATCFKRLIKFLPQIIQVVRHPTVLCYPVTWTRTQTAAWTRHLRVRATPRTRCEKLPKAWLSFLSCSLRIVLLTPGVLISFNEFFVFTFIYWLGNYDLLYWICFSLTTYL